MKLKDALEIGHDCGLSTVREAIDNIEIHGLSLFPYDEMAKELGELYKEWTELNCSDTSEIDAVLLILKKTEETL